MSLDHSSDKRLFTARSEQKARNRSLSYAANHVAMNPPYDPPSMPTRSRSQNV